MKTFKQKLFSLLSLLAIFNVSAQEITPDLFYEPPNTGANMTVGVNVFIFNQFVNNNHDDDLYWWDQYYSAIEAGDGLMGAFYDLNGDGTLECVGLVNITEGFFGLALWGDDSSTPEKDGLSSGDVPEFAILKDGNNVILLDVIPEFDGYVTNQISNILDANLSTYQSGCGDLNACNYNPISYIGVEVFYNDNCNYPEPWFDCEGICLDLNNNSICDIDENPGCMNPLYINYDVNATVDDGSCSETWENSYNDLVVFSADQSSVIIALQEVKNQLESELNDVYYQLDTMQFALLACMESPQCEEIIINIEEGWNIFGYTSSQIVDIAEVMAPYQDKIIIMKDNNGSQYWPANNYNGIGDFIPGGGYQIKAYESFSISFEN